MPSCTIRSNTSLRIHLQPHMSYKVILLEKSGSDFPTSAIIGKTGNWIKTFNRTVILNGAQCCKRIQFILNEKLPCQLYKCHSKPWLRKTSFTINSQCTAQPVKSHCFTSCKNDWSQSVKQQILLIKDKNYTENACILKIYTTSWDLKSTICFCPFKFYDPIPPNKLSTLHLMHPVSHH